jgi:hypothetical protein
VIIPGIIYEIYQGIVRDWDYDLIANSLGIIGGIYISAQKTKVKSKPLSPEIKNSVDDYLRKSIKNRLNLRKRRKYLSEERKFDEKGHLNPSR